MTHHSPGNVQILHSLPGMQIIVPGTDGEPKPLLSLDEQMACFATETLDFRPIRGHNHGGKRKLLVFPLNLLNERKQTSRWSSAAEDGTLALRKPRSFFVEE
jgi:hypothetical protein